MIQNQVLKQTLNIVKKYSYFVDATTGEIIGGHSLDYIYSESKR